MDWWLRPFVEFSFMRRALAACCALSLSSSPIGVFLTLRRMSLVGDATAHAVLPGVALGICFCGTVDSGHESGRFRSGTCCCRTGRVAARFTYCAKMPVLRRLYLIALAFGVLLVSVHGTQVDLMHMLFGSVLAIDREGLVCW